MQRITLHRITDQGHTRYYRVELFATLFGEYVVEREYGATRNKSATGQKKTEYHSLEEARSAFMVVVGEKKKKGYT
ncbi:WGR domain-containing protein [Sulfuricurvum sp. IAE1]|uniref:WGR domain-containing protein n=1 Tax=Sulfuricurvum sp. IAE1 TaxID=2546102 RepID=UPI0010530685|nr:WGR domain-containing protein [Sulfuricurvum sp. IAE1]TDA63623.1 WGR domain-containing protein [Sulfuricurvum sp. IAE1]